MPDENVQMGRALSKKVAAAREGWMESEGEWKTILEDVDNAFMPRGIWEVVNVGGGMEGSFWKAVLYCIA